MTKDEILKAIDDEPEFPGELPPQLKTMFLNAFLNEDADFFITAIRTACKMTKSGIRDRILERYQ